MRGRKPKPAGTSSRRPDRPKDGPQTRLPICPPHLQGEARKEWTRTGKKLLVFGLVTEVDRSALAIYCQAWARWVEAEQQLARYGTVIKAPSGYPMQSPYLAIANKAMDQMAKILVEFGMSPSSRSRVVVRSRRRSRSRHRPGRSRTDLGRRTHDDRSTNADRARRHREPATGPRQSAQDQ